MFGNGLVPTRAKENEACATRLPLSSIDLTGSGFAPRRSSLH